MSDWHVYMLDCDGKTLYTGVTTDVSRRLEEHRGGGPRAARYTRARQSVELVYAVPAPNKSLAMRIEYRLKRLPALEKRAIANQAASLEFLLDRLGLAPAD